MMLLPDLETFVERLQITNQRIVDSGGDPEKILLLPVTKGFAAEAVRLAGSAGCLAVGENYAQELLTKQAVLGETRPAWHFIGQLQSNKVRKLASLVELWQSVDRLSLVSELAKRAPGAKVLVQVAISREPQKGGVLVENAPELIERARASGLNVLGLMGVATAGSDVAVAEQFGCLRRLLDAESLEICSMGMTNDLELAVAEGTTMLRVGRALFGPRTP